MNVKDKLFSRLRLMAEEEFSIPKESFTYDAVMSEEPLKFDALMMVELMFTIEEEFREAEIEFNDLKFRECKTFGEVVEMTLEELKGKDGQMKESFERQVKEREVEGCDVTDWNKTERIKRAVHAVKAKPSKRIVQPKRDGGATDSPKRTEEPIRKQSTEKRERHGRYFRREQNKTCETANVKGGGKVAVREDKADRPPMGGRRGRHGQVETGRDERHSVENRAKEAS